VKECDKKKKYNDGGTVPDWQSDEPVTPELFDKINSYLKTNSGGTLSPKDRFAFAKSRVSSDSPPTKSAMSDEERRHALNSRETRESQGISSEGLHPQQLLDEESAEWDYTKDQEVEDRARVAEDDASFNPEARTPKYAHGGIVKKKGLVAKDATSSNPFSKLKKMLASKK
jgi:hypothetical protein